MTRAIMLRRLLVTLVTTLVLTPPGVLAEADSGPGPIATPRPESRSAARDTWTGTWEGAASGTAPALPGASIRNVVHTSVGGRAARVRLSNRLGTAPLQLGSVTLALQLPGVPTRPGAVVSSVRTVTFGGARSLTLPAGRDVVSDPVALTVPADANLLVSVHTPGDSGPATFHRSALQANFVAPGGDRTTDESGAGYTRTIGNWYYVTGVDVLRRSTAGSVVALGDSITDGTGSSFSADHRWPDRLADRLRDLPAGRRPGVLNAGISGNRVLREGRGPSALTRLDTDVLSRAGVRTVIVLEGINDIKGSPEVTDPSTWRTPTASSCAAPTPAACASSAPPSPRTAATAPTPRPAKRCGSPSTAPSAPGGSSTPSRTSTRRSAIRAARTASSPPTTPVTICTSTTPACGRSPTRST